MIEVAANWLKALRNSIGRLIIAGLLKQREEFSEPLSDFTRLETGKLPGDVLLVEGRT